MYTMIERRKMNREKAEETKQRGRSEFFPKLRSAPGFVGFYLVEDNENGINTAVIVWEDKAKAESFWPQAESWLKTLDELGHELQTDNRGETVVQLEAAKVSE